MKEFLLSRWGLALLVLAGMQSGCGLNLKLKNSVLGQAAEDATSDPAVIVNSLNVLPADVTYTLNVLDTFALTMAMTALGIETRVSQIREAGPRALTTGLILYVWLIAGGYGITLAVQHWLG